LALDWDFVLLEKRCKEAERKTKQWTCLVGDSSLMEDQPAVTIKATEQMLKLLLASVDQSLKDWPGGDPLEQQALIYLRNTLFAASIEFVLERS